MLIKAQTEVKGGNRRHRAIWARPDIDCWLGGEPDFSQIGSAPPLKPYHLRTMPWTHGKWIIKMFTRIDTILKSSSTSSPFSLQKEKTTNQCNRNSLIPLVWLILNFFCLKIVRFKFYNFLLPDSFSEICSGKREKPGIYIMSLSISWGTYH